MQQTLDETASRLLTALADGLPLTLRPYADLGTRIGASEAEVLTTLRDLRARRVLCRVGASFSPAAFGYHAALGGLAVREEQVEAAAAHLASLPGVTHVFEIEDRYRLWYAIVVPSRVRLELAEAEIAAAVGAADRYRVLSDEVFKVTAAFDADGAPEVLDAAEIEPMRGLDRDEKALVRLLQGELPLAQRPFSDLAITLGECGYDIDERWALDRTRALAEAGALRGIEATKRTREEPFRVALTVWLCPADTAASGQMIASFPEVLHCFTRRVPGAGMAVLAVVEIEDRPALDRAIARMRVATDLDAPRVLYPVQEFKRAPMRYFAEGE
jgi:DNA-binding Lrp family transcriptional regulator